MLRRLHRRYEAAIAGLPALSLRPAAALRSALADGYGRRDLRADLIAGLTVGIVALPLSMALAIASGVPPQHGLYTAIIGGAACALLGGSRSQVSGPTAAFVVILAPIAAKFGLGGLCVATVLAGLMLVLLGALRLGQLISYIPYPVTSGFTAGIAVVIATLQLRDFLGLEIATMPEHYAERVQALVHALPTAHWADVTVGGLTLAVLIGMPKLTHRVPAPLVALALGTIAALVLNHLWPDHLVATIGSRFSYDEGGGVLGHGIPRAAPMPLLPWNLPDPSGQPVGLSLDLVRQLLPAAFAIAMLGAIESLLSAVVADGMAETKHDPDSELVGQGIGNILAPFFGGFACTGAIARTATNIRAGSRSPIAAVTHAAFVLLAVLALAPLVSYLPMPALAALLLIVAWNMSEARHFLHVLRMAPKSDVTVQLTCFSLTVMFDMVVAVTVGIMLAALLFMRRMVEIFEVRMQDRPVSPHGPVPEGVVLYEIAGPLFFGAAHKAMGALETVAKHAYVVVLDLERVPAMDATGMVNLESAIERLNDSKTFIILAGLQEQPRRCLERAGWEQEEGRLAFTTDADQALLLAQHHRPSTPPLVAHPAPA